MPHEAMTVEDLYKGIRIPLYFCPFKKENVSSCTFHTHDRTLFLHHVAGGVRDDTHRSQIERICGKDLPFMTNLDYIYGAV